MSISVENITKLYGSQKALDQVSFKVKPGEILGLLGPNGAGKSTLMKIISCFIPPDSGTVKVNDFDIHESSIEVRRRVGYLPENNPLYTDLYVKEYLEFVAGLYKLDQKSKRVAEMIEITGLELEQRKKIGALSKGYKQRVGLAQALIHNPEVLILDEPTSGLDPNQLVEIRKLIQEIGKEKTIMFSTHIMQEVEAICDRVIIINHGKIVADSPADKISGNEKIVQHILVEFNNNVNVDDLLKIEGINRIEKLHENVYDIFTNHRDVREQIFQFAVQNNLIVLSMQKQGQGMADVFQQLTRDS